MNRTMVIFLIEFFLFIYNIILFIKVPEKLENHYIQSVLISVGISLFLFFFIKGIDTKLKKQYFKISIFFILGFLIVHFQIYIDYLLGNTRFFSFNYFINTRIAPKALIVSALAINMFIIGYILRIFFQDLLRTEPKKIRIYNFNSTKKLEWFIFLLFTGFLGFANLNYFKGNYGRVELGSIATHIQTFFLHAVSAYIIVVSYKIKRDNQHLSLIKFLSNFSIPIYILLGIYMVLVLVSGDRGPLIQISLLFFAGYVYTQNKKINPVIYMVCIAIATVLITLLGIIRSMQPGATFSERSSQAAELNTTLTTQSSFSPSTFELAISLRTLNAAVDYTKKNGPKYGLIQFNQLIAIVPGLGSLFRSMTGYENKELISADILTHHILGSNPSHGLGTSCVADVYLDYKTFGVIIYFLLFGFFVRGIEYNAFKDHIPNLLIWVFAFVFIYKAIYIGRSSITILLRECIVIYIIIRIFNLKATNYLKFEK